MAEGFVVKLWCPDCTGEDFQGCFDGGTELLIDDDGPMATWKPRVFATKEEAEAAGDEATKKSIWRFDVEPAPKAPPSPTTEGK